MTLVKHCHFFASILAWGELKQFLLSECDGSEFIGLFNRVVKRAKQKVKYGRQFSRADVGKPKRHHVFRRIC